MKLTGQLKKENDLEIILEGEDHSVATIIRKEVLETPGVIFAGVTLTHPLLKRHTLRVVTKSKDPADVLKAGATKASTEVSKLGEAINTALAKKS